MSLKVFFIAIFFVLTMVIWVSISHHDKTPKIEPEQIKFKHEQMKRYKPISFNFPPKHIKKQIMKRKVKR